MDTDPLQSPEFREGYGEGLTEGVAMFRRIIEPLRSTGRGRLADALEVLVRTAERNVQEFRNLPTNI